jgi:hypothetical protein
LSLPYDVGRRFPRGEEKIIAKFADESDATEFMEAKVAWDHKTKVNSIYRLYHDEEILKEADASEHQTLESSDVGSGQRFSPTPLANSPKPAGSVPYRKEDDIDDE